MSFILQRINFNTRKKKYQVFSNDGKLVGLYSSILVRNLSQLRYTNKKKFSSGRSEHLFLIGEIEIDPDVSNLELDYSKTVIYYPKKHDGFKVRVEGKGIFDIEKFQGYDVYCGLKKYHSSLILLKNEHRINV